MTSTNTFQIASHTFNLEVSYRDGSDFKNHILGKITESLMAGANIVVFPEYTAYGLAKLPDFKTKEAIARFIWTELFPEVMKLSESYDAVIIAGSAPHEHRDTKKFRNRAIIAASGKSLESYKRCLTPWEGEFEAGSQTLLFEWKGHKFANLLCFDVEFPEIASELKRFGPHFVFIEAATADSLGIARVSRCASARAIELGAIVVLSSLVGNDEPNPLVSENIGKCAFYFPAQEVFANQSSLESPVYSTGDHRLTYTVDLEQMYKMKRSDSETKPYLKTLNLF
jgi:predicted amidohydrolase